MAARARGATARAAVEATVLEREAAMVAVRTVMAAAVMEEDTAEAVMVVAREAAAKVQQRFRR